MGLTTCIASSDAYLTTTAAVKLRLGTTLTSDDAYLSDLILSASKWAETYVGYPLSAQAYRETLPSYGTRRLMLARTPVRTVAGLWDATDSGTATTVLSSEYRLEPGPGFLDRDAGWAWRTPSVSAPFAVPLSASPWPGQELPTWMAEYVAGYTRGGIDTGSDLWSTAKGTTSTGRTLPEDLEAAVIAKVVSLYESGGGEEIAELAVGDLRQRASSFGAGGAAKKSRAEQLLAPYVRC